MISEAAAGRDDRTSLVAGMAFLLTAVVMEYVAIMLLNSGRLVYTIDDPYIHLALAENILHGHYGVNTGELSAPSSSILWPFLLAPLAAAPFSGYVPLFLNATAAALTVLFFWKILSVSIGRITGPRRGVLLSFMIMVLIMATNTVGLVFTGMEHSLQLLSVVVILYYLVIEIETGRTAAPLGIAIVTAPLFRYESLAVSLAALVFLFLRGHRRLSVLLGVLIVVTVGGFSLFLVRSGLGALPTSVLAKSAVVSSQGGLLSLGLSLLISLDNSLENSRGVLLAAGLLALVAFLLFARPDRPRRLLAEVVSGAIVLHLLVGSYGWFNRYEIYIWSVTILALLYLYRNVIAAAAARQPVALAALMAAGLLLTGMDYLTGLLTIPLASNNIYEQQYQMHRFAVDYIDGPVAVNDLGYVSYRNDNYVLDLAGLASPAALRHRQNNDPCEWMNDLATARGARLAMIYDRWFTGIPSGWIKIGELHLGKVRIVAAEPTVSFYALDRSAHDEIAAKARSFEPTLPDGVRFIFAD